MKVIGVQKIGDHYTRVTFERDGVSVAKDVRLSDADRACLRPHNYGQQMAFGLMKAVREADRDIAYSQHGAEFRDYCEYKGNFWTDPMSQAEYRALIGRVSL